MLSPPLANVTAATASTAGPPRAAGRLVIAGTLFAPSSPCRADAQQERQQTEIRDHRGGQQADAERADNRDDQDAGEPEILPGHHPRPSPAPTGSRAEKQRQDHDVVDVGDREHAHGLTDQS
ncbi:hypothetical protein GCM10027360_94460 [Amycolatopsis echigonensis]